jgi:hypothetical protein
MGGLKVVHLVLKLAMGAPAAEEKISGEEDAPDDQAVEQEVEIDRGGVSRFSLIPSSFSAVVSFMAVSYERVRITKGELGIALNS